MNTKRNAFYLGFITKIAEAKIDPVDLNDAIALTKIASPLLLGGVAAGALTPALLKTILDLGVSIPASTGKVTGGLMAEGEAKFDPKLDLVEKERIIREYERKISRIKAERNNRVLSDVKRGVVD